MGEEKLKTQSFCDSEVDECRERAREKRTSRKLFIIISPHFQFFGFISFDMPNISHYHKTLINFSYENLFISFSRSPLLYIMCFCWLTRQLFGWCWCAASYARVHLMFFWWRSEQNFSILALLQSHNLHSKDKSSDIATYFLLVLRSSRCRLNLLLD